MHSDNALAPNPVVDPKLAGRLAALIEAYLRHIGPVRLRLALTSTASIVLGRSGQLSVSTKANHVDLAAKVPLANIPSLGSLASTMDAFASMESTPDTKTAAAEIFEAMVPSTTETAAREAWRLIAAQMTNDADFAPDSSTPHATLPMRWATWWRLFSLPLGVLYGVAGGLVLLLGAGLDSTGAAVLGVLALCATAAQAYIVVGLGRSQLWAWRLNWILITGTYIIAITNQFIERPSAEGVMRGIVIAVAGIFLWLWPNYRYWNRRKYLFSEEATTTLPKQWIWAPVATWAVVIISVASAIAVPFIQRRNVDSVARQCPANQRYVADGHRCEWISPPEPSALPESQSSEDVAWANAVADFEADPSNSWIMINHGRINEFNRLTNAVFAANPGANYPDVLQEARRLLTNSPEFGPPVVVQAPPSVQPVKVRCEYKAVMSDDEIALCKNDG